jgi:hypothetical protein
MDLKQLYSDDTGTIAPAVYILMFTTMVVGVVPGIVTVRDQVVQQFGDVAVALNNLDQSYSFAITGVGRSYSDTDVGSLVDPDGEEPACISINETAAEPE